MKTININNSWKEITENNAKLQCIKGAVFLYISENKPTEEIGFLLNKKEFFDYSSQENKKLYAKAKDFNNSGVLIIYEDDSSNDDSEDNSSNDDSEDNSSNDDSGGSLW